MLYKGVGERAMTVGGGQEQTLVEVTFELPNGIWAHTIHLVGDFNNWSETSTPLQQGLDGWSVTLNLQPQHSYQYRYLIDGQTWINDWAADAYVPNAYGGHNSVVTT